MIILHFLLFLILVAFFFILPGIFFLNRTQLEHTSWMELVLGTVVGFVGFTIISYILLLLHLVLLIFPLFLIINILSFKKFKVSQIVFKKTEMLIFLFVLTIGVIGQLLIISPSGIMINGDLVFWSAHGHDGVWHLALVEEIKKGFPLQNPVFAGERLVNYHYFSDLSVAIFNKYFQIPNLDLFFRFLPFLFSILLGAISFLLGQTLGKSFWSGIWAMVFTFFAGSFGYLVMLPRNGSLEGESIFWSSQVQSVSGNPPQAIAFVILLSFLFLFIKFLDKQIKYSVILLSLLAGSLAVIKIYAAIILLLALLLVGVWQIIKERKFFVISIFLISSLFSALLYLPNTSSSGNLLIFEPWWFIRTMIVADNRLNWLDLELRRQTYLAHNNWKWVISLELLGFMIFLFGNLGMRFLGFYDLFKGGRKFFKDYFIQLFILIIFFSLLLPLLFIQKGIPGNTIQFLQYFLLLFGILAGVSTARLISMLKMTPLKIIVSSVIIILAIPTQIGLLTVFYNRPPFAKISNSELQALDYLNKNSNAQDIIINPPYPKGIDFRISTPPIWVWSDTSYIPAFSARKTFVADIEQLDIMGYDFKERLEIQKQIFHTIDPKQFKEQFKLNNIKYVYFPKMQPPLVDLAKTSLQNIFSNDEIEIWKVN